MNIGITGRMQNGKDTVAKMIYDYGPFTITHFADPLKEICIKFLNLSYKDVYSDEGKKRFNEFWGMTNREILQKVGTDAFRNGFKSDIWVKLMELKLKNSNGSNYVIPDVRFDDEAKVIIDNGGVIINVVRPSVHAEGKESMHESERGVSSDLVTFTIINDGTLEDLNKKVQSTIKDIVRYNVDRSFDEFKTKYPEDFDPSWERYKPLLYKIKNPCFYVFFSDYGVQIEKEVKTHSYTKNCFLYLEKEVSISTHTEQMADSFPNQEDFEKDYPDFNEEVIEDWNRL